MRYYGSEYIKTTHYAVQLFITVMTITVINGLTVCTMIGTFITVMVITVMNNRSA